MRKKISIFEHFPFSSMDYLDKYLDGKYIEKNIYIYSEITPEKLNEALQCDLVILLGSPASVNDGDTPWIAPMREFIRECLKAEVELLGICFGAQLIAIEAGARVSRLAIPRFGYRQFRSLWPAPWGEEWLCLHEDFIEAGEPLDIIVQDEEIVYAFRYQHSVGIQFHPEMSPEVIENIRNSTGEGGPYYKELGTLLNFKKISSLEIHHKIFDEILGHELKSKINLPSKRTTLL